VVLIALESWLRRRGYSLPALTVGIGMYLPSSVSVTIGIGGVIGWLTEQAVASQSAQNKGRRREQEGKARQRGVLVASGFLAGESLAGIFIAAADAMAGRSGALAFAGTSQSSVSVAAGFLVFACALAVFYRVTSRKA